MSLLTPEARARDLFVAVLKQRLSVNKVDINVKNCWEVIVRRRADWPAFIFSFFESGGVELSIEKLGVIRKYDKNVSTDDLVTSFLNQLSHGVSSQDD